MLKSITIKEFINQIITFDSVQDILNKYKTCSNKGYAFERLFDIVIKFGFCDIFPNSNYHHLTGNSNNGKLEKLKNIDDYLYKNVISGKSSGCSDITLQNKIDKTFIFISSKYPLSQDNYDKQKSVNYYDVQNIVAMITKNKHIYKNYKIYLLVPNKEQVLKKFENANESSKYITDHILEDQILDLIDLNKYFLLFKNSIIKNIDNDWNSIYQKEKENLNLRFHQELITQKTSILIENNHKTFLWGCKCRSGKTFMFGGLITKQFEIKKKLNVLIITPAPTETITQFTSDLFNKYNDFDKFKIHQVKDSKYFTKLSINSDSNIFIVSKQLLQKYINDKTIDKIKNLNLDIIGFDENHFSGTTDLSKNIIKSYSSKNTIKIYLTATYNKPLKEWNIISECQMYWDIEDEQICKSIANNYQNIEKLKEKHGKEYIENTLNKFNNDYNIFVSYKKMPELHLITNLFDKQRYDNIKKLLNNENKFGFCFETLFSLNEIKTRLTYENEVKTFLRYISGSYKETDGNKTIFTRINKICVEKDTRLPFTQLWFLPSNYINETSLCLKKLMLQDPILCKYDILCINRKNLDLVKDIKNEIHKKEKEAKNRGLLGLIILAGNMLSLGITLNLCDLVILLNNTLSSDKVLQQMYRCMTEAANKKIGFVVDLNISRVLNTCINYTIYQNEKNIKEKIEYLFNNNLINIDVDMLLNKKINSDLIIKKLLDIWKGDPINNLRTLLRKLDSDYIDFDNETQKLLNKTFIKNLKDDKIVAKVVLKDSENDLQNLPSGKEIIKNKIDNDVLINDVNDDVIDEKMEENSISFTQDVLPYIIPLSCILTIKNTNMDFVKMLNDIKNNPELLEIFNDQCLTWWNNKDLIDLIRNITDKFFNKSSNVFNVSIQFKTSLQSLIDNPEELLELINDCLKPKEIEKKENGEVFTPMTIINEMLDKLPNEIWLNKNIKWFDPASGMGNFPIAVYLRLIDSLKEEIQDIKKRKKHILENMIYISELNKKNVYVYKQIFNLSNEYKLNIHQGDTLTFNPLETFNVDKFGIIVGNPPYNKGGIRSHTGKQLGEKNETIWTKFIQKSFEWLSQDGYLLFINPLSWLKKSHSLHYTLLEKHIIWLKLWDDSQSKSIINADIPISIYVLHNSLNNDEKNTILECEMKRQNLKTITSQYLDKSVSIPTAYHNIFNKLYDFIKLNNLKLEYKTKTVKSTGKKQNIPINYKLDDMLAVDTYTIKDGIQVKKALIMHPDANKKKIIIANKRGFKGSFIDDCLLSLTGNHKFYILGNNLELIQKILNFKISNIITNNTKYGQSFLDNEAFNYIPDIRKLNINDINEEQFYNLIGLIQEETTLISN